MGLWEVMFPGCLVVGLVTVINFRFIQQVIQRKLTFGTKTRHNVIVVQNIINKLIMIKEGFGLSFITKEIAAPDRHMMTTL